jgi:SAM-dependent methyltransferase
MGLGEELVQILDLAGADKIWRPVYDQDNNLLFDGVADPREATREELDQVGFPGKTVVDLGCNTGWFSFLASNMGAQSVVGIDLDPHLIQGCELLNRIHCCENVTFVTDDFTSPDVPGPYDIGLMLSFLGRGKIQLGINPFLDALERLSQKVMVTSARYYYRIRKHLSGDSERLARLYGPEYIDGDYFLLLNYIRDYYRDSWDMKIISPQYDDESFKNTMMFVRK